MSLNWKRVLIERYWKIKFPELDYESSHQFVAEFLCQVFSIYNSSFRDKI